MGQELSTVRPQGCTHMKVRQISRLVGRYYDEAHGNATGLKSTQYALLSFVLKLGPLRPGDLAQAMRLDASTLSRNLQPLVAQGWVRLQPGDDARSRLVEITDTGRAVREQSQRAWKKAQLKVNAVLGPERVVALHELLDECIGLLEAAEDA
ncbi:MarR family winged helix-turn-helix transcriptional regulator [Aquincola tertiaricarbonis]|uniref:MarR family winged helix-turn-helix transcriptional regulator n=1 Tax=Aquincola tertiaricarbonis TaxID=391953 RepID=A0ABY4S2R0_AQUTE|nr:MarR family winged helix-turn-helix transcriptional regulator [Aquincola tertiaricarbonis]URI06071.1 MarR family winged helix-turn-helix transcriptional regulator [Aquincola tertiaricarbonis]